MAWQVKTGDGPLRLNVKQIKKIFNSSSFISSSLTTAHLGPDAVKAANWIFSADVDKAPGSVIYTCMLNARGGVEGDLTVTVVESGDGRPHTPNFKEERGFYVAVGGGAAQQGLDHMKKVKEGMKTG